MAAQEETPFFSGRERAALAWTEAVTKVGEEHVLDSVFEHTRRHFSDQELVDLTLAIVAINGWNRLAISFRTIPGTYNSGLREAREDIADDRASRREAGQEAHAQK